MQLLIGNKNYSSWSMRPWVLMREFGIAFEEVMLRFDSMQPGSVFKRSITAKSPAARVPVLVDPDGFAIWDTLAIAETLAERHPSLALWPAEAKARARARSLCAEMHSGLSELRRLCPMNIEASLPEVGRRLMAEQPGMVADLERIVQMWNDALNHSGGPFLFGAFGIADAFFAPVTFRITTYALPVPPAIGSYVQSVQSTRSVSAWVAEALAERDFLSFDEPYRTQPG